MSLLLKNANCLIWDPNAGDFILQPGHLVVEPGGITHCSLDAEPAADQMRDLAERMVTPPLLNAHHHFYSLPARGLAPAEPLRDFGEILSGLWWKLDRNLSLEALRLAARQSLRESIRAGVLTVCDHHSSPAITDVALTTIAQEVEYFSLRGLLCHEVSDRNGEAIRDLQIAENRHFTALQAEHPSLGGMMGLHASFTLSDTTLGLIADTPVHIHLAEAPLDNERSLADYGARACARLAQHGLLRSGTIAAHGNHLTSAEYTLLAEREVTLAHNPHSNFNNAVGTLDLAQALDCGCRVAPGTDGMHSEIAATLKAAFLQCRHVSGSPERGFREIRALFEGMFNLGRHYFDEQPLLRTGGPADLVIWDYAPLTPLTQENIWGHIVYGLLESRPTDVIHEGAYLLQEGRLLFEQDDPVQAQAVFRQVWEDFNRA